MFLFDGCGSSRPQPGGCASPSRWRSSSAARSFEIRGVPGRSPRLAIVVPFGGSYEPAVVCSCRCGCSFNGLAHCRFFNPASHLITAQRLHSGGTVAGQVPRPAGTKGHACHGEVAGPLHQGPPPVGVGGNGRRCPYFRKATCIKVCRVWNLWRECQNASFHSEVRSKLQLVF